MGATSMPRGGVTSRSFLPSFRRDINGLNFKLSSYSDSEQVPDTTLADVELEFLDDGAPISLPQSAASSHGCQHPNELMELDEEEEDDDDDGHSTGEDTSFWDNQHQILQANVYRTSSLESRIRAATKEAIQEIQSEQTVCSCSNRQVNASSCRNCLMREVSRRLHNADYDSAICKTKWRNSPNIPAGEHSFLDVIDSTSSKKGEVRVIIELNLRAEFEMARASEEYKRLVQRLPEVFVGRAERLSNIIKIMCMASKKCMKRKKMHMGPWRKHKYMEAKWLGPCERNNISTASLPMAYSERMPKTKPKASMLTVDLLEMLPNMHCTAVEVV